MHTPRVSCTQVLCTRLRSHAHASGIVHTPQVSCTRLRSRAHASGLVHTPQVSCTRLRTRAHASDGSTMLPSRWAVKRIPCDEITVNRHVRLLLEGAEPSMLSKWLSSGEAWKNTEERAFLSISDRLANMSLLFVMQRSE